MAGSVDRVVPELLPPRERTITMPFGLPEYTLGWGIIAWVTDNLVQPNGPNAGKPFTFTGSQVRFILWFYAVDREGRWLYTRAVRRLAKGSGKSPFAAVLALVELLGPCRVDYFDDKAMDPTKRVIGKAMSMPLVQVAATSEDQTANTMRMVRAMANKRTKLAKKYGLDCGKTYVEDANGGKITQITSSASAAEGSELSFAVADETEHWTPAKGGPDLAETLDQNLAKTGGRLVETCNAWVPGVGSVAEDTFTAWCTEQEGQTVGVGGILYDARVAPHNTVLRDWLSEEELEAGCTTAEDAGVVFLADALRFVYDDCYWVDIEPIRARVYSPTYPVSRSRRFFLNQPNATEDAWVTVEEWGALADPEVVVEKGEKIVAFFDGSKSRDATALVACRMSDGHVFTLGVWQPKPGEVVDTAAVDGAVTRMFDDYEVVSFFGDVREWESFVKVSWAELAKTKGVWLWAVPTGKEPQVVAWDMRSHSYQFAEAAEMCLAEISDASFTHDGNWETSKHVGHARRTEFRGRGTIRKESKDSPKKIDAAVCVIGARMVRRLVLASPEWERRNTRGKWVVLA